MALRDRDRGELLFRCAVLVHVPDERDGESRRGAPCAIRVLELGGWRGPAAKSSTASSGASVRVVSTFAGTSAGRLVLDRLPERVFRIGLKAILTLLALRLLYGAAGAIMG